MVGLVRDAPRALLDTYLREIKSRDLSAVLFVDSEAEDLCKAAIDMGLTPAGTTPVMLRYAAPITPIPREFTVRRARRADVMATNDLMAEAFSLERATVQRVLSPDYLSDSVETWVVEDSGVLVGFGTFIRGGDSVGVYAMSTPARQQRRGIGRAVLEHAMQHYQDRGVKTFTLEATVQGLHLYGQVGFRTVMDARVFVVGVSTQFAEAGPAN